MSGLYEKAIAQCALLEYEKQQLKKMNSEAKVRKSTKSIVLGKGQGKVMSYEDIVAARAARAARDERKGRRGRKRKRDLSDEDPELDPELDLERRREQAPDMELDLNLEPWQEPAAANFSKSRMIRASAADAHLQEMATKPVPVPELTSNIRPEIWSAPVARMYWMY